MNILTSLMMVEPLTTMTEDVDLVVSSFVASETIKIGTSVDISWTVTNQGTETTTSSFWYDYIYLSTDTSYDLEIDRYLGEYKFDTVEQLPLASNQSYTIDTTIYNLVADPGDYYLLFVSDDFNHQLETNEGNNLTAVPLTITTLDVDLVTSVISTPTTAYPGNTINISWGVANEGTDDSNAPYWYDYVLLSTDTVAD
jgi:subtilase family serine protease